MSSADLWGCSSLAPGWHSAWGSQRTWKGLDQASWEAGTGQV